MSSIKNCMPNQSDENIRPDSLFLGANVVLEILLSREKEALARQTLQASSSDLYISTLTAHLIVHFGQARVRLSILRQFLTDYTILTLEAADFEWAFVNSKDDDFEDALQLAVAIRNGCSIFATFDQKIHEMYKNIPSIQVRLITG